MKMDIYRILEQLPHRYPFLLIDRVEHMEPGKSIVAIKNVTINEPYFSGHFPENPVMPGVLILEAMAQAGGILAIETVPEKTLYFFAGLDNVRFKHVVIPGDQLKFHVVVDRTRQNVWKFKGEAKVNDEVVCAADFMIAAERRAK